MAWFPRMRRKTTKVVNGSCEDPTIKPGEEVSTNPNQEPITQPEKHYGNAPDQESKESIHQGSQDDFQHGSQEDFKEDSEKPDNDDHKEGHKGNYTGDGIVSEQAPPELSYIHDIKSIEDEVENMAIRYQWIQSRFSEGLDHTCIHKIITGIPASNVISLDKDERTFADLRWYAHRLRPNPTISDKKLQHLEGLLGVPAEKVSPLPHSNIEGSVQSTATTETDGPSGVNLPFKDADPSRLDEIFELLMDEYELMNENAQDPPPDEDDTPVKRGHRSAKRPRMDERTLLDSIPQTQVLLAKQYNFFRRLKDPKNKIQVFDDIVHTGMPVQTNHATYYDGITGEPLHESPIEGFISASYHIHAPHLGLSLTNAAEIMALRKKTAAGIVPQGEIDESATSKQKREWRDIIDESRAKATKVALHVGFEALKMWWYKAIPEWSTFAANFPAKAQQFSAEMKREVDRIIEAKGYPIYVEVSFDFEKASQLKVILGRPQFADKFGPALESGSIRAIIDATQATEGRLGFVGKCMDFEKNFGPFYLRYWWNDPDTRRLNCRMDLVRATYLSPSFNHNKDYTFLPLVGHFSLQEAMVKAAVTLRQEQVFAEASRSLFENDTHLITLIDVPGTHHGHFIGFIDNPVDDSTTLTTDTILLMTFDDAKVGDTVTGALQESADANTIGSDQDNSKEGSKEDSKEASKEDSKEASKEDSKQPAPDHADQSAQENSDESAQDEPSIYDTSKLLVPAHKYYKQDLPHGAALFHTSGDNLLCGLEAFCQSFTSQHPELSPPTIADLQAFMQDPTYVFTMIPGLDNQNDFFAQQVWILGHLWCMSAHGKAVQLGILQDPVEDQDEDHDVADWVANAVPTSIQTALRVWVHHAPGHWTGVEKCDEDDAAAVHAGDDHDSNPDEDEGAAVDSARGVKKAVQPYWSARVLTHFPNAPADKVALVVSRYWNKEKAEFDPRHVQVTSTSGVNELDLPGLIARTKGQPVKFKVRTSQVLTKRTLAAINGLLNESKKNPFTKWNILWRKLLTFNGLDTLKSTTIFADILGEFPDPTKLMDLNREQAEAMKLAENAPGGIFNISGASGTGKSHMIREIARPFLMAKESCPILLTSGPNVATDTLIVDLQNLYLKLVKAELAPPGRIFIRLHADSSEKAIRIADVVAQKEKDPNARPDFEDVDFVSLSNVEVLARDIVDKLRAQKYKGIRDQRVQHKDLSLGEAFARHVGLIQDPVYTHPDADALYADFRKKFCDYYSSKESDKDVIKEFRQEEKRILAEVLASASVVACTLYVAGSSYIATTIGPQVVGIVVDEAPHEGILPMLPIAAHRLPKCKFVVFAGDTKQCGPVKPGTRKDMPFVDDVYLPLPLRLEKAAFPTAFLRQQSRMLPQIGLIVSQLSYGGQLTHDIKRCGTRVRPYARSFSAFLQEEYTLERPQFVAWLDISGKIADTAKQRNSKINWYYAITSINLARKLMRNEPEATVACITGYSGQRNILASAKASMQLDQEGSHDIKLENLTIGTIDQLIGHQFDYVVLDLLVDNTAGFFNDLRRLTVALSRARDGLIILLGGRAVDRIDRNSGRHLKDLIRIITRFRIEKKAGRSLPGCRYLTPPSANIASLADDDDNDVIEQKPTTGDWEASTDDFSPAPGENFDFPEGDGAVPPTW